MPTRTCSECSRSFHSKPSEDRKYCSRDCYLGDVQSNRLTVECSHCGSEIERAKWHADQNEGLHFCDRSCVGAYNSGKTGEDAWAWKGGYDAPQKELGVYEWQRIRQWTLSRDDHRCWACGLTNEQNAAIIGQGLDVHHEGHPADEDTITTCRFCHSAFD